MVFLEGLSDIFFFCVSIFSGCLQFSFAKIIREELSNLAAEHNDHPIRKSFYNSPHGTPNELYYFPSDFGEYFYH